MEDETLNLERWFVLATGSLFACVVAVELTRLRSRVYQLESLHRPDVRGHGHAHEEG